MKLFLVLRSATAVALLLVFCFVDKCNSLLSNLAYSGQRQYAAQRSYFPFTRRFGGYDATVTNNDRDIEFYTLEGGMCPYAARTLIVLHELGMSFDTIEVTGRPKPDWYLRSINPRGKVPALRIPRDDNLVLYESAICNEYLCDYLDAASTKRANEVDKDEPSNNKQSLMPQSPADRARIRLLNDHYDSVVGPAQFTFLMNTESEKDEALLDALENSLDMYELTLQRHGGPFLWGDVFTLADAHVLPFFLRLVVSLGHYKGYSLPRDRFPRLLQWYDTCSKRASVQAAAKSEERIIEVYKMFLETKYKFGGLNKN